MLEVGILGLDDDALGVKVWAFEEGVPYIYIYI